MRLIKNITVILVNFILIINSSSAQIITFPEPVQIVTNEHLSIDVKKGAQITIYSIHLKYGVVHISAKTSEGKEFDFEANKIEGSSFINIDNRNKVWIKNTLLNGTLYNLVLKGHQYGIRKQLNEEAVDYISTLQGYNVFYHDEYFEDYLYTLANKIHSGLLYDKRPGNIFIKIIKDPEPNAFCLSNGTIIISTGLLSIIQSEDELVGVLAHEIAHFVLDHQIINYNKTIDRRNRAEFWRTFATAVAATSDIYLAANNKNYIPGILTASVAISSTIISDEIVERVGIKYNQQQEIEADKAAKEILEVLKYDKFGLSVALSRIKNYSTLTGNYRSLSGSESHPSIELRIQELVLPEDFNAFSQTKYLKKVSLINSYNALIELENYAHLLAANELVTRNIDNNVATEIDYVIKAIIKRRLSNTKESNEEVVSMLNKAKTLNVHPPLILHKEEAISLLRLDRKAEAKTSLQTYLAALSEYKIKNDINNNSVIDEEIVWTKKMIFKIDHL